MAAHPCFFAVKYSWNETSGCLCVTVRFQVQVYRCCILCRVVLFCIQACNLLMPPRRYQCSLFRRYLLYGNPTTSFDPRRSLFLRKLNKEYSCSYYFFLFLLRWVSTGKRTRASVPCSATRCCMYAFGREASISLLAVGRAVAVSCIFNRR